MTISTPNIALGYLFLDLRQAVPILHHEANVLHFLSPAVVELQDEDIGLAAVHAWVLTQVARYEYTERSSCGLALHPRPLQVGRLVGRIVRSRIAAVTLFALRVDVDRSGLALLSVKLRERFSFAAVRTHFHVVYDTWNVFVVT